MKRPQTSLDLLLKQFPGKLFLSVQETGIASGRCGKTVRNEITLGVFPVKTVKIGRRRLVPIADLAAWLDTITDPNPVGRPRSSGKGV